MLEIYADMTTLGIRHSILCHVEEWRGKTAQLFDKCDALLGETEQHPT